MAVTPYNDPLQGKKAQVERMFDNIARRYDLLNHVLSFGIDISWRKRAVRFIGSIQPQQILDVASGTGDFALECLSLHPKRIIGLDISEEMMKIGREKAKRAAAAGIIEFMKGDSEQMPFNDNSFDAITVGFGVRNFEDLERGLKEMHRVLRKGGKVAILEASMPRNAIIRAFYSLYFGWVVPGVGKLISNDVRAYSYLPESVRAFPEGQEFINILEGVGFNKVEWQPLTLGACAFYSMEK